MIDCFSTIEKHQILNIQNIKEDDNRAAALRSLIMQTTVETIIQLHIFLSNSAFR